MVTLLTEEIESGIITTFGIMVSLSTAFEIQNGLFQLY